MIIDDLVEEAVVDGLIPDVLIEIFLMLEAVAILSQQTQRRIGLPGEFTTCW